ncbi:DUF6463 family protein [Nocardia jiangsuensis]|uniref:DUF6463 family protein n=1 Tax=Nocardia jiangsuensis TaxID=1691563 RepID=A0ABV8DL72_9NOCA
MITWAGRLLLLLGAGHLLAGLVLTAPRHGGDWFSGGVWGEGGDIIDMTPANSAFWLTAGSFGLPLALIGALVMWLDRRDIAPPTFLAVGLGVWSVFAAIIFEPAPWPVIWIAVGLLVAGARRQRLSLPQQPQGFE